MEKAPALQALGQSFLFPLVRGTRGTAGMLFGFLTRAIHSMKCEIYELVSLRNR